MPNTCQLLVLRLSSRAVEKKRKKLVVGWRAKAEVLDGFFEQWVQVRFGRVEEPYDGRSRAHDDREGCVSSSQTPLDP